MFDPTAIEHTEPDLIPHTVITGGAPSRQQGHSHHDHARVLAVRPRRLPSLSR
jgi:hypothetical protein